MLRELAPAGAPALQVYTLYSGEIACPIPLTNPWRDPQRELLRTKRERALESGDIIAWLRAGSGAELLPGWLEAVVGKELLAGKLIASSNRDQVTRAYCDLLASRHRRADGLPGWQASDSAPNARAQTQAYSWTVQTKKLAEPARAILAAVAHDLEGMDRVSVSGLLLGLSDHEKVPEAGKPDWPSLREASRLVSHGEAEGATRKIRKGRRYLSEIGAWPWVHAPDGGRLPQRWWLDKTFDAELEAWWKASLRDVMRSVVAGRNFGFTLGGSPK